jgi:hypothetical protein
MFFLQYLIGELKDPEIAVEYLKLEFPNFPVGTMVNHCLR